MKKFAVVLAGCGVFDGSEIHEATLSLYAIKKLGATYDIFAPDIEQYHVINHLTGETMPEKRNVLVESARIARGKIKPLSQFDPVAYDALLIPGGFGAAKNLSTFAFEGVDCKVNDDVVKAVKGMHNSGKPIGALCIAPVLLSRILGLGEITIGSDKGVAEAIEKMGGKHKATDHGQVITDSRHKLFTTPCYMLDADIAQIGLGAENIVRAMLNSK
ncbi:MAG TPA: isoprenoid biosynthesis glyoxalase ElbB [Bacteroidales bacterium]|nr:isoprenoid biosynthesis glyoxalase ElbB [Bacteroidales bacterium]